MLPCDRLGRLAHGRRACGSGHGSEAPLTDRVSTGGDERTGRGGGSRQRHGHEGAEAVPTALRPEVGHLRLTGTCGGTRDNQSGGHHRHHPTPISPAQTRHQHQSPEAPTSPSPTRALCPAGTVNLHSTSIFPDNKCSKRVVGARRSAHVALGDGSAECSAPATPPRRHAASSWVIIHRSAER